MKHPIDSISDLISDVPGNSVRKAQAIGEFLTDPRVVANAVRALAEDPWISIDHNGDRRSDEVLAGIALTVLRSVGNA